MEVKKVLWMLVLGTVGVVEISASTPCPKAQRRQGQVNSGASAEACSKVSLRVVNILRPPFLNQQTSVSSPPNAFLLDIMELAANQDKNFRFSGTFFDLQLGWSVDAYNGVYANYSLDRSYWLILDSNLKPVPLGISHYIPSDGETVTFNLTIYTADNSNKLSV